MLEDTVIVDEKYTTCNKESQAYLGLLNAKLSKLEVFQDFCISVTILYWKLRPNKIR